jgi:hypothetical protein
MEAVIARIAAEEEARSCSIEGCLEDAAYHVVKINNDNSEEEKFFCESHGQEYAIRGHLVISENS